MLNYENIQEFFWEASQATHVTGEMCELASFLLIKMNVYKIEMLFFYLSNLPVFETVREKTNEQVI